jgi:organic radical activating enzyme
MTDLQVAHLGVTFQGSGHLIGERQYFCRLSGCSVRTCPIRVVCDERPSLNPKHGSLKSIDEVVSLARESVGIGGWLHITGGEPTDHGERLTQLIKEAQSARLRVHVQTSGLTPLETEVSWLTVSPKTSAVKLAQRSGHELLIVYRGEHAYELNEWRGSTYFGHYFLQPLWESDVVTDVARGYAVNVDETASMVHQLNTQADLHNPKSAWRLTLQAHKYWEIL